ncbi:MAG: zf-HC2 domain-containing protein [Lachnospiraceae bacterium]|nr:zf-HC2 domain-containing protein [Lachnospiraceae bacterium]
MECKEYEKLIPAFLNDSLEGEELAEFVDHIKQCRDCEEELAIQFLSVEGLARLEEGASFSLDKELEVKLKQAGRQVKISRRIERICKQVEGLAAVVLGAAILYMIW